MLKNKYKNIKILYVEDDEIARENGIEYLENYFEHIYEASDAIKALQLYEKHKPDIIITDISIVPCIQIADIALPKTPS